MPAGGSRVSGLRRILRGGLPATPFASLRSLALLLLIALIWAQHAAALHALSHYVGDGDAPAKQLPLSKACEQCAALGALDAGVLPFVPDVVAPERPRLSLPQASTAQASRTATHYRSRAPPSLLA